MVAGCLSGVLFAEIYLAVALFRSGTDLFTTSVDRLFAVGLIARSAGLYALLFAAVGGVLGAGLRLVGSSWAHPERVFAVVSALLGGLVALAYLTLRRQIEDLAGVPLGDPQRWSGAIWDGVFAVLLSGAIGAALWFLGRPLSRLGRPLSATRVGALGVALLLLVFAGDSLLSRHRGAVRPSPPGRVVVVGLDGLTFRVLSPLLRAGRLPAFQQLIDEGAWGNVMTYGTVSSARIWTSLATGKRVRDHGIDDFVKVGDGYQAVPFKSSDRKVKAIWNILSELDRSVAIVDWYFTFPPEEVNGAIVSRLHLDAEGKVFPPELETELAELLVPDDAPKDSDDDPSGPVLLGLEQSFDVGAHFVQDERDYDFVAIYDSESDSVEHTLWKYYEPRAFDPELWRIAPADVAALGGVIPEVYQAYDRRLAELLEELSDDTLLIVISDHGQRAARRPKVTFRLNRLLADLGFASLERGEVDFAESRAFQLPETLWKPTLRVNLNVAQREPRGTVDPQWADSLRREIVDSLAGARFEGGGSVFRRVRSEPFGRRTETTADIEVFLSPALGDPGNLERELLVGGREVRLERYVEVESKISGNHDRQGVLFLRGPGVRSGFLGQRVVTTPLQEVVWNLTDKVDAIDPWLPLLQRIGLLDPVTTLDLTPMVLHALGERVARDMSGSPRAWLWRGLPPIRWLDTYEAETESAPEPVEEPSDAEELERLKALGYVS